MTTNNNLIGNLTTIIKYICMAISGWAIGILISHGLNLPITEAQLSEILFTIIIFIIGYLDSRYPNTFGFLGNQKQNSVDPTEPVLNPEYETEE